MEHINQSFDTPESFKEFVDLSQKTQAQRMQLAIESHCKDTLFWQFNDCWPGPSWSVIDYYGNRKEAYQVVKDEFSKE